METIIILLVFIWGSIIGLMFYLDYRIVDITNKFIDYINEKEIEEAKKNGKI